MATLDLSKLPSQQRQSVNPLVGAAKDTVGFIGALGNAATAAAGRGLGYGASALLRGGEAIAEVTGLSGELPTAYTRSSERVKQATDKFVENFKKGGKGFTEGHGFATATGEILGSVAGQVPFLAAGGEALKSVGLAGAGVSGLPKAAGFVAKSLGRTAIVKETSEGKLPSKGELGVWLAVDTALLGASTLFRKYYEGAFNTSSGISKKQIEGYVAEFGQTPGKMARETYGYTGTATNIQDKAYKAGQEAWRQLGELANTGKPVTQDQLVPIMQKIVKPLLNGIPAGSERANEITDAVIKSVVQYAPAGKGAADAVITPQNIVGIIKDINADMFKNGAKVVINESMAKKIVVTLKTELKKLLPDGARGLYTTYAQNDMIWKIMNSENVKRIVGRSIVGGTGGAATGVTTARLEGKNWGESIVQGLAGGIAGFAIMNALDSTFMKTVFGKNLGTVFAPEYGGQLLKTTIMKPSEKSDSKVIYPTLNSTPKSPKNPTNSPYGPKSPKEWNADIRYN